MSNAILLKKITLKEICELKRDMPKEKVVEFFQAKAEQNAEIAVIAGEMTGYGGRTTQFGESVFLTGLFFAQNRETGQMYKAGKVYLPKDATENLVSMFQQRDQADKYIRFQLSVRVVEDSGNTGYTYVTEPVRTPESINREAELMSTFAALPAPEKKALKVAGKK